MTVTRSVIVGCGSYLPPRVLSNNDLAKMVDIQNADGHPPGQRFRTGDDALDIANEALEVGQVGQRVGVRLPLQACLGLLAGGDIETDRHEALDPATAEAMRHDGRIDPV